MGAVTARIDRVLGARYRDALARAVEAMETPRYLDLVAALDALVLAPPWTPRAEEPAHDVVPRLVRRDHKRLRRQVDALEHEDAHAAQGHRHARVPQGGQAAALRR